MYQINNLQERIIGFIRDYIGNNGYPPTIREIQEKMGYKSPSSVHNQLNELQAQGFIEKKNNSPRTIRILKEC